MTLSWWWGRPEWAAYCDAYNGQPPHANYGKQGNMIVALDDPLVMWKRLRKGHRSDIRSAEKSTQVMFDTDGDAFDVYQALHEKDAGRKTRPQRTFDLMREWLPQGYGLLALAIRDAIPIGAAYFITYLEGSYYASAARDPDLARTDSVGHLLVWKAMCRLHEQGRKWLDLGPLPDEDADTKQLSIAFFKRGFGPEVRAA